MMTRDSLFAYTIIRKPKLKHLYLRISEGKLTITANDTVSEAYIRNFISGKSAWIQKHLSQKQHTPLLTDTDASVYLLGKALPTVVHIDSSISKAMMQIEEDQCIFIVKDTPTHTTLKQLRDDYYKTQCAKVITPIIETSAQMIQLYPQKITYRHNKSRWGSCSTQNNISLNTRLMMLPQELIRYIIIHELSHIIHKNHSQNFWELVQKYEPDYKKKRRLIRPYEKLL